MSNKLAKSEEDGGAYSQKLDEQLKAVYIRLQHRHLANQLDKIANTLEGTLIRAMIAESLFNDFDIKIDEETRTQVSEAINLLKKEQYDELESEIPDLRTKVEEQRSRVDRQISIPHADHNKQLNAMQQLNEKFDVLEQSKLDNLETRLNDEQWVESINGDTTGEKLISSKEYGETTAETLGEIQSDMFTELLDDDSTELASKLISDEPYHLTSLGNDDFSSLQRSKLGDYIELSLSPLKSKEYN
ncbi:hypothetical protein [Natronocalculus amylovorans]|uniref:Uncharacterized protein n=1 Tax=Natronocalculus amylovorans TaxID=2917812 RepID=A0AAE3FZ99_9EURY|nr:hypothetical protein [Natronocalculus amylovorans]MCL9817773.1 hypothetical protein [Natronocalculus amylovorans]